MAETMEDFKKMKVPELKQALKDKGLPISGTKPELIKRLGEALGASDDTTDTSLDENLQGIDEILNEDSESLTTTKAATTVVTLKSPIKPGSITESSVPKSDSLSSNGHSEIKGPQVQAKGPTAAANLQVSKLSEADRLKMRAEKFGNVSTDAKLQQRAERFGIQSPTASTKLSGENLDKLKKRAERFGTVVSSSLSKVDEDERKRKRAERFGVSNTTTVKTAIKLNSTDSETEAKKQKRAERFGLKT